MRPATVPVPVLPTFRRPEIRAPFAPTGANGRPSPGSRVLLRPWFWLLLLLLSGVAGPGGTARAGSILREVFQGISGGAISDLTNNPAYPLHPSLTNFVSDFFEAPTDVDDNYGQRMHGYVIAPLTGNYTFWIASDDNGSLYLSTDESPTHAVLIASVPEWTSSREWTKYPAQQSAPIPLVAGRGYYVSALQKEGGGGDNLAVRWLRPDGVDEGPIPATALQPWGTSFTPPVIDQQPTNTTAIEGQSATFTVTTKNFDAAVQWQRNTVPLPGATGLTLVYGPVTMDDDGAQFSATLTNKLGRVDTQPASLKVLPDTTPPTVVSAINLGGTGVQVVFSEPVSDASAGNPANFHLDGGITVSASIPAADHRSTLLTVSLLSFGTPYTVTVNGVLDQARTPNPVPNNSQASFTARELVSQDVGTTGGSIQRLDPTAWNVIGGGADVGGSADQFQYGWERRTGNFDVQVRVASVDLTDPFVHAGLMARASLNTNSVFAGVFSASPQVGCFFETRATTGAAAASSAPAGGFPVNPPQTWLRLRRSGNSFTGFGSLDGQVWVQLGTATLTLPSTVYFGLALSGGSAGHVSTAQFRDYTPTASLVTGPYVPTHEPLGPANRRTGLVFSEVMYHARGEAAPARAREFVELYNANTIFEEIGGWRITGDIEYTFPAGYVLPAGEFIAVAADPAVLIATSGATRILGPYVGTLGHSSGTLRLVDSGGAVKLEFTYSANPPWPVAADGAGPSLTLVRPSYGLEDPRAWGVSEAVGGSPGTFDTVRPNPQANVVINEFLANPEPPAAEYLELYNHGNTAVDLSGCFLSDSPSTNRFRIPDGTSLPPRGFLTFDRTQLGFGLSSAGETLYLVSSNATRVIDALRYGPQERGVASGRSPDGSDIVRRLSSASPGQPNPAGRTEDIVINELMYAPISGDSDDEYVELYNRGTQPLDLADWRLSDGVDFKVPAGVTLNPGDYLVIGRNVDRLRSHYPQLGAANSLGNYNGSLRNSGDHLALTRPQSLVSSNDVGELLTNIVHAVVSEVTYVGGGRWGKYSAGGGSSLELTDPHADLLQPSNWADSDESQKSSWVTNTVTGVLAYGMDGYPPNRLHLGLLGMGEALVDDVEVIGPGGSNRIANPGFESGVTGWSFFGNHSASGIDSTGALTGQRCLHLRSQGDNDTGINSVRTPITGTLNPQDTVTLRVRARWVAGWPEVLVRVHGNWLDLATRLNVPVNLGTPGLPNSRLVANAAPAIYAVTHSPALPAASQAVVVSCRVSDPDGIASVNLRYRTDPTTTYTTVAMHDDGTGGDAVAGDGVWSATIAGRAGGVLVGFVITSADAAATPASGVFPQSGLIPVSKPTPEGYIRWGDPAPAGNFAHYHLWSSQASENLRTNPLNNTYRDATLVYGNFRVIYNAGFRDKGSPFHGGGGSYAVNNPDDEPLLGVTERVFRTTGNGGAEDTGFRNLVCAWIGRQLGIPYLHGHYMQLYRNGAQHENVSEDEEAPNNYYAQSWFPDGGAGDLYKIAVWFEFQDDNSGFGATGATLESFPPAPNGGAYRQARYRWNWQTRGYQGSANNYTNIFNLVTAANDTTPEFVPKLMRDVDVEEWMRIFAYHRVLGNWDSYTFSVGQNMYALKAPGQRWVLMPWDIDFTLGLGNGASDGLGGGQDPVVNQWYNTPAFERMLWRAYRDAVDGPLDPARYTPIIEARRAALAKNGITGLNGPSVVYTYLTQRRAYIQQQLAANDAASFAVTTNNGQDFTSKVPTATIEGRAPFAVATLQVNAIEYPVTWTGLTTFSLTLPLGSATNALSIVGIDRNGRPVPGAIANLTIRYSGAVQAPQDFLVLNEIHYNPVETNTSFIELFNNSTLTPFDLSGWRLEGVGLVFPDGIVLAPGAYGVVAKDRTALLAAYGASIPVLAEFPGSLSNGGEHLRLVKPGGLDGTNDLVVSDVRYDQSPPWSTNADGFGPSLQLIDPLRGSYRVANWATTATNSANRVTPGRANAVKATLAAFPSVWINEILPNNVGGPTDGAGEHDPYVEIYNSGTTIVSLASLYLTDNYTNLTQWHFPALTLAPGAFLVVWADGQPGQSTATEFHTGFRLNPTNGTVALARLQGATAQPAVLDYVGYRQVPAGRSVGSIPDGEPRNRRSLYHPTLGAPNDPSFPKVQVTFNEFLAANTATLVDPATGKAEDWFELFNAGPDPIDLTAYTVTDDPTTPAKFTIPSGFVLPSGGFLLAWADKTTAANKTDTDLHVSFKLSKTGGFVGLYGPDGLLVDSLNYGTQTTDVSQGRFPDGGDLPLATFAAPTPRGSNALAGGNQPPVLALIPPQSATEGQALEFTVNATDPDPGQSLTYSLGIDAPPGAEIEADTGHFRWTPNEEQGPGTYNFAVRATDNGIPARTGGQRVTVTVAEANRAPVLPPLADRVVSEGSPLTFPAAATDPDRPANQLFYSLADGAPTGARIDPSTGDFIWTPSENQGPGVYQITVLVRDDGTPPLGDSRTFQVTVNEVDNPPALTLIPPQNVNEGETLTVTAHAVDPDQPPSAILYSLEGDLPGGIHIEPDTGVIRWTPTEAQGPGTYVIILRATEKDGAHLSAVQSFGITVAEVNQSPVLGTLPTLTVREGDPVAFNVTATDADLPQQSLAYSLGAGSPNGAFVDPENGHFTWTTPEKGVLTTNTIVIQVADGGPGNLSDTGTLTVITTPRFRAVINEILYHPAIANASYVEFFNPSTVTTQALAGVSLSGENLRYVFPAGSHLDPGAFLVLAQNRAAFAQAYGAVPVFGEWIGQLDRFNTRLALQSPDGPGGLTTLQEVDYRASLPWSTNADTGGTALQLLDARRDATRVGNWTSATGNEWRHVVLTGTASSSTLYLYLESAGDVYVDDVSLVAGNVPEIGDNMLADGDFEGAFPGPFIVSPNHADSALSTTIKHGGNSSLHLVASTGGTTRGSSVYQDMSPALTANAPYTLSYWYLPNPAGGSLVVRLSGSGIKSTENIAPDANTAARATPGTTNSVAALIPEFPPVWINEVLPDNRSGLTDAAGATPPWIELINRGPLPVDLSGWWLTPSYINLAAWTFPAGTIIPADGFLVVFADNQPGNTTPGEWHTNFRPNPTNGVIALVRPQLGQPAVVDYIDYQVATPDQSFGRDPRDFPVGVKVYATPTPGADNTQPAPVLGATVATDGTVTLSWAAQPGTGYRVDYRDTLAGPWQTLRAGVATETTVKVTDNPVGHGERYYRVVIP